MFFVAIGGKWGYDGNGWSDQDDGQDEKMTEQGGCNEDQNRAPKL